MDSTNRTNPPQSYSIRLAAALGNRIIGQPRAIESIVPSVQMYEAGLSPEGRPVGVFLLLGPTGTGKTKTVEALANELHGSETSLLKIDCGEFQMEHEVAKLIGAPPGYLGHRETHPMISQQKLEATTSEGCGLSIVLFDEIEKAAPSLSSLLLGVLDRATLHLGDNTVVDFESSLIFLTSNLGAEAICRHIRPGFGYLAAERAHASSLESKIERTAMNAVRRHFSPEFVNRLDEIVTYRPLGEDSLLQILDQQIAELRRHIQRRLMGRAFDIEMDQASTEWLLRRGTSAQYGARELKRTIHRSVTQPLAAKVANGEIAPGSLVRIRVDEILGQITIEPGSCPISEIDQVATPPVERRRRKAQPNEIDRALRRSA